MYNPNARDYAPGMIPVTPELLTASDRPVNFFDYIPLDTETMGRVIEHELEFGFDFAADEPDTVHDVDYYGALRWAVGQFCDGEYPECYAPLFDAVELLPEEGAEITTDSWGWGRLLLNARLSVNAEKLYALAVEYGVTEVHNGHGISGFVRTCEDSQWVAYKVISQLLDEMAEDSSPWFEFYEHFSEMLCTGEFDPYMFIDSPASA